MIVSKNDRADLLRDLDDLESRSEMDVAAAHRLLEYAKREYEAMGMTGTAQCLQLALDISLHERLSAARSISH